ncbi:MAG: hypothetical protein IJ590_00650 [Rickettsiales bacterium]|nr:hypothetical protein [Rickettsiales bacterium]
MGTEKWEYSPSTFTKVDTNNDGLLNSTELSNYYNTLYHTTSDKMSYQTPSNIIANADINGDGLISKGELALYKSGQDYLDKNTFKTQVLASSKFVDIKDTQWKNFRDEYNLYDSNDIIAKGEIIGRDLELNRKALSFSSKAFNASDNNNDGFLNSSEIKTYLENYGPCSDKTAKYIFDNLDINKDGLVSDGEFAMFKVNSDTITSDKLVKAGFSKSDADALVKKYTQEGKNSFTKDDVDTKDNQSQVNTKDSNTKKDGITVGGVIALISFFLCIVGIIAWGIWWLNKDDKKKETTTEIKEIKNDAENNLETIDAKGKTMIIE